MKSKIYSDYAFTAEHQQKADINYEIYKELKEKYKISITTLGSLYKVNQSAFDVVLTRKQCYNSSKYRVFKNAPPLTTEELALICDGGNLCFGYTASGITITVFED